MPARREAIRKLRTSWPGAVAPGHEGRQTGVDRRILQPSRVQQSNVQQSNVQQSNVQLGDHAVGTVSVLTEPGKPT